MNTKLVLVVCAVVLCALAANATTTHTQNTLGTKAVVKAGGIKEWLYKRAAKFVEKIKGLIAKLKIIWPFNEKGEYTKDGKVVEVDEATATNAVNAAFDNINKASDDHFKPEAQDLASSNPDEAHTNAALEAADSMIDPADPPSNDPDASIATDTAEASGSSDSLLGFAAKAITRADAAAAESPEAPLEAKEPGGDTVDISSFVESRSKIRTRRRGVKDFIKKASTTFLDAVKSLKVLMPQMISAGIGANAGPLAFSIDLGVDLSAETMGAVICYGGLFGTDSIGVAANYHIQVGWYGKELREKAEKKVAISSADVWGGLSVGVTASVGFAAASVPLSVGAAISWGASKLEKAWDDFVEKVKKAHTADKTIVEDAGSRDASINLKTVVAKVKSNPIFKDLIAAKDLLVNGVMGVMPNVNEPIVANIAIGTGVSAADLAAGADIMVNKCIVKGGASKVKLWKMLLGLFLVSGPVGAIAGLFSWMAYHADVVKAALSKLKGKLVKIGQTVTTWAKGIANFWTGRLMPATKEVLDLLAKDAKETAAKLNKAVSTAKAKITYFFAEGNFLKKLVSNLKDKIGKVFSSVKDKLKSLFSSKKKKKFM